MLLKNFPNTLYLQILRTRLEKKELHILIIDDNDKDVARIEGYLKNYRKPVILSHVRTGEEAIQKLKDHEYDLCILDVHLPGLGGLDFIRHVLEHGDNLPTVVITGRGDEKTAVNAMKLGAYDYLLKKELDSALVNRTVYHAIEDHKNKKERERLREELEAHSGRLEEVVKERTWEIEYLNSYKELILSGLDEYIRVVDPVKKVVQYESIKFKKEFGDCEGNACFAFWKKEKECENCISVTALEQGKIQTKEETSGNKIYKVTALPLKNRDGSLSAIEIVPYSVAYGEGFEDMERRQPDTTKIRSLIGWRAEHSLDQIIDATAEHMRTTGRV